MSSAAVGAAAGGAGAGGAAAGGVCARANDANRIHKNLIDWLIDRKGREL